MFSVGQKVVCINDDFSQLKDENSKKYVSFPVKGETYTIRDVTELGITLQEIINEEFVFLKHNNLISEPRFALKRFIPLNNDFQKIEFSRMIKEVETSAN